MIDFADCHERARAVGDRDPADRRDDFADRLTIYSASRGGRHCGRNCRDGFCHLRCVVASIARWTACVLGWWLDTARWYRARHCALCRSNRRGNGCISRAACNRCAGVRLAIFRSRWRIVPRTDTRVPRWHGWVLPERRHFHIIRFLRADERVGLCAHSTQDRSELDRRCAELRHH